MSDANPAVPFASEHPANSFGRQFRECIVDVPEHGLSGHSSTSVFNPDNVTKNYDIERVQPSRKLGFCSKYFEQMRWNALKTFGISILVMGTLLVVSIFAGNGTKLLLTIWAGNPFDLLGFTVSETKVSQSRQFLSRKL
jgi:hypothetical protein